MKIFGRFVFGTITNFFGKMHYRYEIYPYAKKNGYTKDHVYQASLRAHKRAFDDAWPDGE